MPEALTIPSPAASIAATLASPGTQAGFNVGSETTLDKDEIADLPLKGKDAAAKELKKEPDPKTVAVRSLTDSIVSDEVEDTKSEVKKADEPDEPRKDEKPAQFIKRIKQERDEARAQLKQAQEKASQRTEATPDEIAALRKELAERDQILEETAYEKSKAFRDQFKTPIDKASAGAKDLIAKFTDTKGVYEKAMALDGKERLEFLKEHLDDAAGTVFDRMARVDELTKDRDDALADREEIGKTLAKERESSATNEVVKAFDGMKEEIVGKLSAFRGEHGEAMLKQAKSLLTGDAAPADVVKAAYLAAVAPHYIGKVVELQKQVATLEARIKEDGADRAGINGRGTDGGEARSGIQNGKIPSVREHVGAQIAELRRK